MADIFGAAASLIGKAIDVPVAFGLQSRENSMAAERETFARNQNYLKNEEAAQNADQRTRALYSDLYSPQAQMEQIKAAGLSPSLFYGDGGGISGQSGAQGAGAAGISPNVFGINEGFNFAELGKVIAETDLIRSQTKKTEEETKTEAGINDLGKARIENIIADTNNKLLKNVYQEYENSLAEIEVSVSASLEETKVQNYIKQTEYLSHLTKSAEAKGNIDQESQQDVINYLKERTTNLVANTLLKKAQTTLTKENVNLTKEQVLDLISQITTREEQLNVNKEQLKEQVKQWGEQNRLKEDEINTMWGGIAEKGVGDLLKLIGTLILLK